MRRLPGHCADLPHHPGGDPHLGILPRRLHRHCGASVMAAALAVYAFTTVTLVLTELAMKQFSWAAWCILSSSSALGIRSPLHVSFGRSSTRVIAILPSAFFSMYPIASSSYASSTNFCLHAIARNVSMWQLESEATKASSGSTLAGLPR